MNTLAGDTQANPRRTITVVILAALFYFVLGALGLGLAIAPGYASPIFPAAGLAVAILLWSEQRAWPGIWIGSFTLNLGVAWLHGDLGWHAGLIAAGIAIGATVQALFARWLVLRSVKSAWRTLENEGEIIRCLAFAGPIACTVSATVGVTVLYWDRAVPGAEYLYSWWNWWSGDTLGVLVMLPLSLTVLYRGSSLWRSRLATLVAPMLIALALVAGAFYAVSQWERSQLKTDVKLRGEALAQLLEQRFIAHQEALSALRRLLEVTPEMSFRQFEYFTRITLKDNPDIFALSINPYVLLSERKAFERRMTLRTSIDDFEIKERDGQRRLIRAADRPEYVAVGYIAPIEGNRTAVGYDINSDPTRNEAIQRAQRSGEPTVTAPIQLVQENKKRVGVLLLHPAYSNDGGPKPLANTTGLTGFVVGVIKVDEMIQIATRPAAIQGLAFHLEDTQASADGRLLYRSAADATAGDDYYSWQKQLVMADRIWKLSVVPTTEFIRQQHHWAALLVGAGGLMLAALLQMLLLVTTGRTAVIQRRVQEQTAELLAKSDALEDRNAQLDALFSLSPDAFVAFAPDGSIKFVNPAFQSMTGIMPADVVGQSITRLNSELLSRCDNPEVYDGITTHFDDSGELKLQRLLTLKRPRHAVLQVMGIHSESSRVSRILYLREITQEAEIDSMKSDFLSHAAHELRTPMASILGFSELLLEVELDATTRKDLLETIHRQTKWLVDIINELLDLTRIESRRGKDLKIEDVDVSAIVRDTVADLALDSQRWPVSLNLPSRAVQVRADSAKLRQTVSNVLSNASKYSPAGGTIQVKVVEDLDRVGIVVSDSGIGMTEEQLKHFGERFWRADSSGKTPGTGLGIAIVKEIMKLLGGSIEVSSKPSAGTTVSLWLVANKGD